MPSEANNNTHIERMPIRKSRESETAANTEVNDHGGVNVEKILLKEYYNMDEKWSKDLKIARKRLIAMKSFVAQLYIKRGDVRRAIANHETVKGIDRMVEEESMKAPSNDERALKKMSWLFSKKDQIL